IMGLIAHLTHATDMLDTAAMLLYIFFAVGMGSIAAYIAFAIMTKETASEFVMDGCVAGGFIFATLAGTVGPFWPLFVLALGCFAGFGYQIWNNRKLGLEWPIAMACLALWILGVSFYFYEAISGMTNPPMEWGYPRTWDGFMHALTRGQYEKANPTDIIGDPKRFLMQLKMLVVGISEEFNWVLLFVAAIPFFFFRKLQRRERAWLTLLGGIYFCIGIILVILMNPSDDRGSVDLHRVFFASSHGVVAIMFGMGLALICAYMATNYQRFRQWGLVGGGIAIALVLYALYDNTRTFHFGPDGWSDIFSNLHNLPRWIGQAFQAHQGGLPVFGSLILVALPIIFVAGLLLYQERAPLAITLAVFAAMPVSSALRHWGTSEQRNHWYGYWFGHDMFTPPFEDPKTKQLSNDNVLRDELLKVPEAAKHIYPEMARNAILFGGTDPGRFCPTYMIFCESFIPHKDQPGLDQHFDRRDVYIITQNALADPTYLEYIRAQYNRSTQIDTPFFQEMLRSKKEKDENYMTNGVARLAYKLLDVPLTRFGAKVEKRRREEGVYPPKEIYCPTDEDSKVCFNEYMQDAGRRLQHDMQFPNEPKQIRVGEEVHTTPDGRMSVAGQTAVMSINGLLTKVIFDHNPSNEFYVEESFPLDWMYPYLSPYGIIMKINREPLNELTQEIVDKDHEFWSKYSERTIGNWMTYNTSMKDIGAWVEKVYLEHDYTDFKGDMKFIRDDQAQKAFSKLRSSIGGVYDWRFTHPKSQEDQMRMLKEAEFAYRQAFAYCPYSPEVVSRYVQLLLRIGRVDDALIVAQTCLKLDPKNGYIESTVRQLIDIKNQHPGAQPGTASLDQLEKEFHDNPNNFQAGATLAVSYINAQQNDKATKILDELLNDPKADGGLVVFVAQNYANLRNIPKLEIALEKLSKLEPHSPEIWCDLAAVKAQEGKNDDSIKALTQALDENSKRLAANPKSSNIAMLIKSDPRFTTLRALPAYQKLMAGQ
ncbi:MAG TPA: hypothetical protein VFB72_16350, partial [Verrucomicrobiae bacterium]|nr:hypothetical protein [Verrucomicrobiae bacterium]